MKRSEMVIKMQRFYAIRFVMVEGGYMTMEQFMGELLDYLGEKGMLPPRTMLYPLKLEDNAWDQE